jgi:hypothetical protein
MMLPDLRHHRSRSSGPDSSSCVHAVLAPPQKSAHCSRTSTPLATHPAPDRNSIQRSENRSLQLLLGPQLVGVAALLLPAVGGTRRQAGVALAADHLLAVVLGGQGLEGGLDDTTAQAEDEVEGRLLLYHPRQYVILS